MSKSTKVVGTFAEDIVKSVGLLGEGLEIFSSKAAKDRHNPKWKEMDFPESYTHSPDFRPDLVQDFCFQTALYDPYIADKHRFRVYMPLRKNKAEVNTKYMNQIINIVAKHMPEEFKSDVRFLNLY